MFSVCFLLMYTTNLQVVAGEFYKVSIFQFSHVSSYNLLSDWSVWILNNVVFHYLLVGMDILLPVLLIP